MPLLVCSMPSCRDTPRHLVDWNTERLHPWRLIFRGVALHCDTATDAPTGVRDVGQHDHPRLLLQQ